MKNKGNIFYVILCLIIIVAGFFLSFGYDYLKAKMYSKVINNTEVTE